MDVWESDGVLSVHHGHTKTTPCDVVSCLQAIAGGAFKTSQFPLLLILELHVRDAHQLTLTELLQTHLGQSWW